MGFNEIAMKIPELQLLTSDLKETENFYAKLLMANLAKNDSTIFYFFPNKGKPLTLITRIDLHGFIEQAFFENVSKVQTVP